MKLYYHHSSALIGLSMLLLGRHNSGLFPTATAASATDCCLCDDCTIDSLYGTEVGVDAPSTSTTTAFITDCGDLAANLLLNRQAGDAECTRQKFVYGPVCCPASAITTTTKAAAVLDNEKKTNNRDLQWTIYSSFGSTTAIRPAPSPPRPSPSNSWWWTVPSTPSVPRPTTQWFPAPTVPRPAPTAPRPAPTNWGNSLPTTPATTPASTGGGSSSQDWINAHNNRRNTYHSQNGVSYVAVKWSEDLASSARSYTQRLLNGFSGCNIQHKFQGDSYGGENLALQTTGSATSISAEAVLRLWYDGEIGLPYPQNGHLTQVVWRGTMYVGCAGLTKSMGNGQTCHIQTCRYLAPGNCNGVGNILAASSPCAPQCPREGCF
jgi:Cysteine-rich secretory protein family